MTTIVTSLPAGGLVNATIPWHSRIHDMGDGYRAVVYSTGSAFKLAVSASGSTAWNTTTPINGTTGQITTTTGLFPTLMGPRIDAVRMPPTGTNLGGLYVFAVTTSGTGVNCYWMPYKGGGLFGAVTSLTVLFTASTLYGLRACVDSLATTTDSQHTAGTTGLIHLALDTGGNASLCAVDVNTSSAGGVKNVGSIPVNLGIPVPLGVTNAILRKTGHVFLIAPSGGSYGWYACEVAWTAGGPVTTTTTGTASASAADTGYLINANATKPTAATWYRYGSGTATSGTGPTAEGATEQQHPNTWGYDLGAALSGYTVPAGTWTLQLPTQSTNMNGCTVKAQARCYELTAGGSKLLIGTIPVGAGAYGLPNTGFQNIQSQGSLPAHAFASGSHLYIEVDFYVQAVPSGTGPYTVQKGVGNVTLGYPTPFFNTTTTTTDAYAAGVIERPVLLQPVSNSPGSTYGAALCLSDTTSDPGIDLFWSNNNAGVQTNVATCNRTSAGAYVNAINITGAIANPKGAPAVTADAATGDEAVLYWNSAGTHINVCKRTGGVWGTGQQQDTSASSVEEWIGPSAGARHVMGAATAYLNGTSLYPAQYEDQGYTAGAQTPLVTSVGVTAETVNGLPDATGSASPYSVTSGTPLFGFVYNEALANDAAAAYRMLITKVSDGTTVNDSGWLPFQAGPLLPGATWWIRYGSWPASQNVTPAGSIAALAGGVPYNVQLQVQEKVGGLQGGKAANTYTDGVTFQLVTTPSITPLMSPSLGDVNVVPTVAYAEAQDVPAVAWDFTVLDASGVTPLYRQIGWFATAAQSGVLSTTVTAGANQFQADVNSLTGTVWFEPNTPNADGVTISGAPSGTGPYTYTISGTFAHGHTSGLLIYAQVALPSQYLKSVLQNGASYTFKVVLWGQPSGGYPAVPGQTTFAEAVAVPVPPTPTGLTAVPAGSITPTSGASVTLSWTQPAPGTGQVAAVSYNVYQQLAAQNSNAAGAWTLVKNIPAAQTSVTLYSMENNHAYNYAVAACQNEGVEAPWATVSNVTLSLTDMLRMNQAGNPALTIGLGLFGADAGQNGLPELDPVQDVDMAVPYNRTAPLVTRGTSYYYQTAQALSYMLPPGYQDAIYNQLKAWDQAKTTLQFRTGRGDVFYGVIRYCRPSYADNKNPNIQAVVIDISQVDAGTYGLLAV